jgi:SOS response regulatory protein OraA/RecX
MQDNFASALEKALHRLKNTDRFESDIRACLSDYSPQTVGEVIDHLRKKGILNDARASRQVLARYSGKRALGRNALMERQVAAEFLPTESEERDRLWTLLTTRFSAGDDPMRAGRFLFSRGFRGDDIEAALERFFGEVAE